MTIRTRRSLAFALATTLLLLGAPAGAKNKHHKHQKHHGHGHHHQHGCGHGGYSPRYVERHYYGYPVYHPGYYSVPAPEPWFCRPCGHHFDSYDDLNYHVHVSHHIPIWRLPHVIVNATFDW
ncbi:MAG: hypothetical protein ACREI8_01590 [Myxococcota bacterium]